MRSFPESEFALPEVMAQHIPLPQLAFRKAQRLRRQQRVRTKHDRLVAQKKQETLTAIEERTARAEARQRARERLLRAQSWLCLVVLGRCAAQNLSHRLRAARSHDDERERMRLKRERKSMAVAVIQRSAKAHVVYKQRHLALEFWKKTAKFHAKLGARLRWRA